MTVFDGNTLYASPPRFFIFCLRRNQANLGNFGFSNSWYEQPHSIKVQIPHANAFIKCSWLSVTDKWPPTDLFQVEFRKDMLPPERRHFKMVDIYYILAAIYCSPFALAQHSYVIVRKSWFVLLYRNTRSVFRCPSACFNEQLKQQDVAAQQNSGKTPLLRNCGYATRMNVTLQIVGCKLIRSILKSFISQFYPRIDKVKSSLGSDQNTFFWEKGRGNEMRK